MGKNQHVTPPPDGGWQVKGERNEKATVLLSISSQKLLLSS
jgi:hypothetical protein